VKVEDVNEVADLLASSQGEKFVQGCIGVVQAVPTTVIFLHGEEAEGTVLRPFDLELLPGLQRKPHGGIFVQGLRLLPQLYGPAHGRYSGAVDRRDPACRSGAAMGPHVQRNR